MNGKENPITSPTEAMTIWMDKMEEEWEEMESYIDEYTHAETEDPQTGTGESLEDVQQPNNIQGRGGYGLEGLGSFMMRHRRY